MTQGRRRQSRTQRLVAQRQGRGSRAASGAEKGLLGGLAGREMARGRVPGQGTAPARAVRQEQACVDTGHEKEQACTDTEHEVPERSARKGEGLGAWCRWDMLGLGCQWAPLGGLEARV